MKANRATRSSLVRRATLIAIVLSSVLIGAGGAFMAGALAERGNHPAWRSVLSLIRNARTRFGIQPIVNERLRSTPFRGSGVTLNKLQDVAPDMISVEEQIRALEALGYASGTQLATQASGVLVARSVVKDAIYLVNDGHAPEAYLMNAEGRELHRWTRSIRDVFPEEKSLFNLFRRVQLLDGGDLLAIYEGVGIVRLDADSNIKWSCHNGAHHDMQVNDDGSLYVLARRAHIIDRLNPTQPILEDFVTLIGPNGEEREHWSVLEAVEQSAYRSILQSVPKVGDVFHTNSLEVLDGKLSHVHPAFKAGNILLSLLQPNALVILDPGERKVVWGVSGLSVRQHDAHLLSNGHIMVFDNHGDLGKSRVIEFDPTNLAITWEYSGRQHDLFSDTCGTAKRLPNGYTLISETDRGRALIITPSFAKVWEYITPHRTGDHHELIASLFEVAQLSADLDLSWLDRFGDTELSQSERP